jgi:CheY-like chemotaxis protein
LRKQRPAEVPIFIKPRPAESPADKPSGVKSVAKSPATKMPPNKAKPSPGKSSRGKSSRAKSSGAKPAPAKPSTGTPAADAVSAGATEASLVAYAHDIRTALTGILALSELLAASTVGERERRWASGIKGSAEHLSALTTLMIDAAQAEGGTLKLQEEAFDLRPLIGAVTNSLSARADTKDLVTEVAVADLPQRIRADAVRLRAALENLIDNAVKFTERGKVRLEISAEPAKRGRTTLVFSLSDTGIGLKPAEIHRLFRPFTQANADIARRYGGTGLGLVVVKALAQRMGGDLTVVSTYGEGSTFRFAVQVKIAAVAEAAEPDLKPSAKQDAKPDARSNTKSGKPDLRSNSKPIPKSNPELKPEAPPPPAKPEAPRLFVLCVEDNPYGRVILNTILTELGHRADFAGSGEEALAAVTRGYDAVLMDMTLPGIDGLEATRRIRALAEAVGQIPIVGISGRSEPGDEAAARMAGMNAYLRKPLSPKALSDTLAGVLLKPA